MPQIVTFIGWHNSGKTTLATQVVSHLKESGYRVAVIKSSKEKGIVFDKPGTDTAKHRQAGADSVLFVAPDQMVLMTQNDQLPLADLAHRYFPDVDIVIGEGFKNAEHVAKIEVVRGSGELMQNTVPGVIAVATDRNNAGENVFRLDESREIAAFIEKKFLKLPDDKPTNVSLTVNGKTIPLNDFVREALANTVAGFISALKCPEKAKNIELRVMFDKK